MGCAGAMVTLGFAFDHVGKWGVAGGAMSGSGAVAGGAMSGSGAVAGGATRPAGERCGCDASLHGDAADQET